MAENASSDKIYFITGINRGIGFNLAKQLSSRPHTIVIGSARDPANAPQLQALIKSSPNVHAVKLDVTNEESIQDAAIEVGKLVDGIDVLIANAGISDSYFSALDCPAKLWSEHYFVNALGPVLVFKSFYPLLLKRKTREIIFISSLVGSIGGYVPFPVSAYGQSKAALNYSAKEISSEIGPEGFTVIAVHPGLVSTDMGSHGAQYLAKRSPDLYKQLEPNTVTPQESASALLGVFDKLTPELNGSFLNYDGSVLPW